MKKAFTLIELLLVITLLIGLMAAVLMTMNGVLDREKYNQSKEQLKNYLNYTKYKSVNDQTNATITVNIENNSLSSPFDSEIEWLKDFTNDITILEGSNTNISFNFDGSIDNDLYLNVMSKDGAYSNRLHLSPIGIVKYQDLNTNSVVTSEEQ